MLSDQQLTEAMQRALTLATRGPAQDPNPQVGCVILDPDARIVSEGWHRGSGTPHAEADALAQLTDRDRDRAAQLTAVVTLEPCNHYGSTPPCAHALIETGIGHVVYGAPDPGDASSGGAQALREAGVQVTSGILAGPTTALRDDWWHRVRPVSDTAASAQVIAKWAQTLDGRIAAADGTSQWITGPEARADVHTERARADVIVTTTATVAADNPSLTAGTTDQHGNSVLAVSADQQPLPVVIGNSPVAADVALRSHPALAAHGLDLPQFSGENLADDFTAITQLARSVRQTPGPVRIVLETGGRFMTAALAAGIVTELHVYLAPTLLGGPGLAITDLNITTLSQRWDAELIDITPLGRDLKLRLRR